MKRIVHLGLGNFHRAHQAWYTFKAGDWKITGVAITNAKLQQEMSSSANMFLLGTWGQSGLSAEVIDVIDDVLLASQQGTLVASKIADENTHIVTVTITEKGYHLKGGQLDFKAEAIVHDLLETVPTSAIGILAKGLIQRFQTSGNPISVVSCDNLSNNGKKLKRVVSNFIEELCPEALCWIDSQVSFPATMVDRITPRLSEITIEEIRASAGIQAMPVVGTEEFSEWIIEDDFSGPRPGWDVAGATFVRDVSSFEHRKLRLLNGAHSFIAYAGLNAGYSHVHEAIADEEIREGVNRLWEEASSTLLGPATQTVTTYRSDLLMRFGVPELRHSLEQIAMDGSVKLSERLVPVIRRRSSMDQKSPSSERAIRAWAKFVVDRITRGENINDPYDERLREIIGKNSSDSAEALSKAILECSFAD
jgi:fructuronate reductase